MGLSVSLYMGLSVGLIWAYGPLCMGLSLEAPLWASLETRLGLIWASLESDLGDSETFLKTFFGPKIP
jgi:hypothetical protein